MQEIILNNNLDVLIQNGDFITGESTEQHQQLLLMCNKGDFKEHPSVCVGVAGWLKDNEVAAMLGDIKKEFERDGMTIRKLELKNDKLVTDARY